MLLVIRRLLSSLLIVDMPSTPEDFSFNFRRSGLRGRLRPPCRYGDKKHINPGQVYPVKAWFAIDADEEPLMPTNLSKHGANPTLFPPAVSEAANHDSEEAGAPRNIG